MFGWFSRPKGERVGPNAEEEKFGPAGPNAVYYGEEPHPNLTNKQKQDIRTLEEQRKKDGVSPSELPLKWGSVTEGMPITGFNDNVNTPPAAAGAASTPTPANQSPSVAAPAQSETPSQRTFKILFIRHTESCANMVKKLGASTIPGGHTYYVDPPITHRGAEMALERGDGLPNIIETKLGTEGTLYYGASGLRRTQQTANALIQGGAHPAHDGIIYAMPYISELGGTPDNTVQPSGKRDEFVTVNYTKLDAVGAPGYKPDVMKFFEWLWKSDIFPPGAPIIRLVIVTHAGWMGALAKLINNGTDERYENLDAAAVSVTYDASGNITCQIPSKRRVPSWIEQKIPFEPASWDALAAAACPDGCVGFGKPLCSSSSGTICQRLIGIYKKYKQVDDAAIKALEKDLRIIESYRPAARPKVLEALDNLKKHTGGGGFFQLSGRPRDKLPGDLLPLLEAYTCQMGSTDEENKEACKLIWKSLARDPNQVSNTNIERIANLAQKPMMRNYTQKTSGWFGVRRGAKYTKSREGLRKNLKNILTTVCKDSSNQPSQPVVSGGARRTRKQRRSKRRVSHKRNRHHKKRATHRKRRA